MEQVKLVTEATREELEAALAALDDPYKKFKDALKAGKRVRYTGHGWRTKDDIPFRWNAPPEMYEIEPDQPELYCGHTLEQWKFVIDGVFDVKVSSESLSFAERETCVNTIHAIDIRNGAPFFTEDYESFSFCSIVRRKNHPQPAFGRSVNDRDWVLVHYEDDSHDLLQSEGVDWSVADWFINLSRDG